MQRLTALGNHYGIKSVLEDWSVAGNTLAYYTIFDLTWPAVLSKAAGVIFTVKCLGNSKTTATTITVSIQQTRVMMS